MAGDEYGSVIEVATINLGAVFAVDAAISATSIILDDVSPFEELGGQIYIDGSIYTYTAVNYDTNTLTLLTGLIAAAVTDDTQVEIYPPKPQRTAMVAFAVEEGETVRATIPHYFSGMPDGVRVAGTEETVLVEERNPGELYLKDVMAEGMIQLGAGEDLDNYTANGNFVQMSSADAATGTNYPIVYAGILEVLSTKPSRVIVQRYTAYRTTPDIHYPSTWTRVFGAGSWSGWQPMTSGNFYEESTATTANTFTVSTVTDVIGSSITMDVASPDDIFEVDGVWEVANQTTAGGDMIGQLSIDGFAETKTALWNSKDAVGTRRTIYQHWRVTGLSVGSHVWKLRVSGPIGVYQINTTRTTLTIRQV